MDNLEEQLNKTLESEKELKKQVDELTEKISSLSEFIKTNAVFLDKKVGENPLKACPICGKFFQFCDICPVCGVKLRGETNV